MIEVVCVDPYAEKLCKACAYLSSWGVIDALAVEYFRSGHKIV